MKNVKIRLIKGQSILEYTIIVSIIAAVVMAMSTYVYRAAQGTQQVITKYSGE